jgi:hypothetical protein
MAAKIIRFPGSHSRPISKSGGRGTAPLPGTPSRSQAPAAASAPVPEPPPPAADIWQSGLSDTLRDWAAEEYPDNLEAAYPVVFLCEALRGLGPQGPELLSAQRPAQEALVPRPQARGHRAGSAIPTRGDPDRGQGFRNPAHPGAHRSGSVTRDALSARRRQDHAPARPDGARKDRPVDKRRASHPHPL